MSDSDSSDPDSPVRKIGNTLISIEKAEHSKISKSARKLASMIMKFSSIWSWKSIWFFCTYSKDLLTKTIVAKFLFL